MTDTSRRSGDEHAASENRAVLFKRIEGGQPRDRQGCGLREGNCVRQEGGRVGGDRDDFRPRARGQKADHASARSRSRMIGGSLFNDTGKIPSGTPSGLGGDERTPDLAKIEGDRFYADQCLRWERSPQREGLNGETALGSFIDNYSANLIHRIPQSKKLVGSSLYPIRRVNSWLGRGRRSRRLVVLVSLAGV